MAKGLWARIARVGLALIITLGTTTLLTAPAAQAARLSEALVRLDRLQTNVSTSFMVTFIAGSTTGVSQISLGLPGFSFSAATVSTGALDPGVTPLPGSLSASASGSNFTVSGVGALTPGVSYGFNASTVNTPAPGAYVGILSTLTPGNAVVEQTDIAIPILSSDQIGAGGNVNLPPRCIQADFNHDHKANIFDLSILLSHYGRSGSVGDMNGDGKVNVFDLSIFLNCYGFVY